MKIKIDIKASTDFGVDIYVISYDHNI